MKRIHTEDDEDDPSRDSAASLDTSGVSSTQALPAKKKPRSKQKDSSHEFSSREIARLRHMGAVDHSSLFRLQVTELLKEVSVKGKLRQRLSAAVDALTKLLLALPAGTEHELSDRSWLQTLGVRLPLVETPAGGKGRFRFEPPSKVTAEGSFVLDTIVKPRTEVDLALHIPKSVFQPKDHLNQRCVRKQALYLAHVAAALRGHKDVQGLGFQYHRGNPLKPTLVVSVKGKDCKTVSVRVHARLDPDTFKLSRFDVNKNNIRPRWYLGQGQREEEDGAEATSLPPTPVYNMSVLHDLCAARHLECMRQSVGVSEGLRQGVMLLTVWLRQRQAHEGWGSFPEDLLCSVVALLVGRGQLNTSMTGYQVFRAVLQYLSQADWQTDPPSLCAEVEPSRLVAFTSRFPVVFVDGSGWLNLAYTLTAAALLKVRQEAKLTISALGKSEGQKFQVVFLTHKSFPRSFDYLCHVTIDARSLRRSGERVDNLATAAMDVGGQMSLALTSHLEQLLTSALDDRVTLVCAAPRPNPQWSVNDAPLDYDEQSYLTFGLCLNTSAAFSVLNKGPPADHPEALAFREMWGDKSEMRRFKDGTIHEAVLWSRSSLQADRRLVCGRIVRYVLQRHCGIDKSCVHFLGGRLDTLLQAGPEEKGDGSSPGTGEEHSLAVLHAFEEVGRAVRALNTLPLAIHSVQGTHPVFRHTDVFPAEPAPPPDSESGAAHSVHGVHVPQHGRCLPAFVPALTVVCTLEGSGKWPEDREAIACLKALLHVKMAAELREKHLMSVGVARSHVDVFKAGYVFRLTVSSQREISVLRTVVSESGMVKFKDTEEAAALERDTVSLPLHTHLLHGLQQEQPSLSAAVRLCKRWLAAQMMWGYVTEEAVELIVAHTYISPHPHAAPGSPVCGLLRFLHLVSTHNWSSDPLMINLNADFTEEDFTSIPKELSQSGNSRPPMCLATPQDRTGSRWTRPHPTGHFLRRLVVLARASLHSLETQLMSDFLTADFKLIFRPALQHFHLLIRLLARANVVGHQAVDARSRPPLTRAGHLDDSKVALPVVGFNVCRKFVHDLQNIFGEYAMFFHDPFGGDVIGLVWKPQVSEVTGFKASSFPYRRPSVGHGETVSLTAGREHILDDIRLLGGGIVQSIEAPGDCPVD